MGAKKKLNIGCGNEILPDFVNLDVVQLSGVDVVHDLLKTPWPFEDSSFEEILGKHVLEHLPNPIHALEEIWRIVKPGAKINIRVPYWNSLDFVADPTHIHAFHQRTFEFFDPSKKACRERPYYSKARFKIHGIHYWWGWRGWLGWKERYFCAKDGTIWHGFLGLLSEFLNNIVWVLEVDLEAIK